MGNVTAVCGNRKTGRLLRTKGNHFVGERLVKGGKFETKRFIGDGTTVEAEWKAWREEAAEEALIRISKRAIANTEETPTQEKGKDPEEVTVKEEKQRGKRCMYLLAFQGQRTTKGVAVFENMEEAIFMSDALTVALDVNGQEGKYVVEELPVWGAYGEESR